MISTLSLYFIYLLLKRHLCRQQLKFELTNRKISVTNKIHEIELGQIDGIKKTRLMPALHQIFTSQGLYLFNVSLTGSYSRKRTLIAALVNPAGEQTHQQTQSPR